MISGMLSPGIDLRPSIRDKTLLVQTAMPESTGSDNHLNRVMETIDELQAEPPDPRRSLRMRPHGVQTSCLRFHDAAGKRGQGTRHNQYPDQPNQQWRLVNSDEELSGIGFSSVVDAVVQLRFVETDHADDSDRCSCREVQGLGPFQSSPVPTSLRTEASSSPTPHNGHRVGLEKPDRKDGGKVSKVVPKPSPA